MPDVVEISLDELKRQTGFDPNAAPAVSEVDPLEAFTDEELVNVRDFNPVNHWIAIGGDKAPLEKLQRLNEIFLAKNRKGMSAGDWVEGFKKLGPLAIEMGKGLYGYAKAEASPLVEGAKAAGAISAGTPVAEAAAEASKNITQQKAQELAALETSANNFADMATRLGSGIGRKLHLTKSWAEMTPGESMEIFLDRAAKQQELAKAASGDGATFGPLLQKLKAEGVEINADEVRAMSTVEPLQFMAMGGGFGLVTASGKVLLRAATQNALVNAVKRMAPQVPAFSKLIGQGVTKLANAGEATLNAAGRAAKETAPVIGGIYGLAEGGPIAGMGGWMAGQKVGKWLDAGFRAGGRMVGKAGRAAGEVIAEGELPRGVAAAVDLVGKPAVGAGIGGAGDVGMNYLMADNSAEMREQPAGIGMFFGGATGFRHGVGSFVTRELTKAHPTRTAVTGSAPYGETADLDTAHRRAMQALPEDAQNEVNLVRELVRPHGGRVYVMPSPEAFFQAVLADYKRRGITVTPEMEKTARLQAQQSAMFRSEWVDADGNARPVVLVNDPKLGLIHDVGHVFQFLLGEDGNRKVDDFIQRTTTPEEREAFGRRYVQDVLGEAAVEDWREKYRPLVPAEFNGDVDRFMLREMGADHFEVLFRNQGGEIRPNDTLRGLAGVLAGFLEDAGQRPVEAQTSMHTPVSARALNEFHGQLLKLLNESPVDRSAPASATTPAALVPPVIPNQPAAGAAPPAPPAATPTVAPTPAPTTPPTAQPAPVAPTAPSAPSAPSSEPPVRVRVNPTTPEGWRKRAEELGSAPSPQPTSPNPGENSAWRQRRLSQANLDAARQWMASQSPEVQGMVQGIIEAFEADPDLAPVFRWQRESVKQNGELGRGRSERMVEREAANAKEKESAAISQEALDTMTDETRAQVENIAALIKFDAFNEGRDLQAEVADMMIFARNAQRTARWLATLDAAQRNAVSPYEVNPATGSFTPKAWQALVTDYREYTRNQNAGWKGGGEAKMVAPPDAAERRINIPPVREGYKPAVLGQFKERFLNAIQGEHIVPKTDRASNRAGGHENLVGQAVARANQGEVVQPAVKPKKVGKDPKALAPEDFKETNPLRAQMERMGFPARELETVVRRFNLSRTDPETGAIQRDVQSVTYMPGMPFSARETDITRGGFRPRQPTDLVETLRGQFNPRRPREFGEVLVGRVKGLRDELDALRKEHSLWGVGTGTERNLTAQMSELSGQLTALEELHTAWKHWANTGKFASSWAGKTLRDIMESGKAAEEPAVGAEKKTPAASPREEAVSPNPQAEELRAKGVPVGDQGELNLGSFLPGQDIDAFLRNFRSDKELMRKFSAKDVNDLATGMTMLALISGRSPEERVRVFPREVGTDPFRKNSDRLFRYTFDLTTICPRQDLHVAIIRALEKKQGKLLDPHKRFLLGRMLADGGFKPDCWICYGQGGRDKFDLMVSRASEAINTTRRIGQWDAEEVADAIGGGFEPSASLEKLTTKWTSGDARDLLMGKREPAGKAEVSAVKKFQKERGSKTDAQLEADWAELNGKDLEEVPLRDLILGQRKSTNPFETVLAEEVRGYAQAASFSNQPKGYSPYWRQVLDTYRDQLLELNKSAGARLNSQTDFRIWHILDTVAMLAHLQAIGGMAHVYTRVPEFLRIFGKTGIKFNMSTEWTDPVGLPSEARLGKLTYEQYRKYFSAHGEPDWNSMESFPKDQALAFRKQLPGEAGTMLVAVSEYQVWRGLDDPNVDMIIPYHRGQVLVSVERFMGAKDFAKEQHEVFPKASEWKAGESRTAVMPDGRKVTLTMGKKVNEETGAVTRIKPVITREHHRNSHADYKAICEQMGITPRFKRFFGHKNYMKLVRDVARDPSNQRVVDVSKTDWKAAEKYTQEWVNKRKAGEDEEALDPRALRYVEKRIANDDWPVSDVPQKETPPVVKPRGKQQPQEPEPDSDFEAPEVVRRR